MRHLSSLDFGDIMLPGLLYETGLIFGYLGPEAAILHFRVIELLLLDLLALPPRRLAPQLLEQLVLVHEVFVDLRLGVPVLLAIEIDTLLLDPLAVLNVLLSLLLHAPLLVDRLHV